MRLCRYWKAAEALGSEAGSESLKAVYTDLVKVMQQVGGLLMLYVVM
jgi:hypothetical protein